jgi:hypothetical protein
MADRFSELIQARCQPGFAALVERAAQARGMTHSEYVRQAARTALQLDGFDLAAMAARDAGALYDSVEGRQRYAMVDGSQIVFMSYHDAKPDDGRNWLPVVHEDSEPFDIDRHWRLNPIDRIEADRVVRTYPVVVKSGEFA